MNFQMVFKIFCQKCLVKKKNIERTKNQPKHENGVFFETRINYIT